MNTGVSAPRVPFRGLRGHVLSSLLQLNFVRFHRVQLGFVEHPAQYERFLAEVVIPRVLSHPGPVGIFGAGEHTRVALKAAPALAERAVCLIDNNQALWNQERFGLPVRAPKDAVTDCAVIFLSTAVYQHVLRADLARLGFTGPIVAVDDAVPPHWFLAA